MQSRCQAEVLYCEQLGECRPWPGTTRLAETGHACAAGRRTIRGALAGLGQRDPLIDRTVAVKTIRISRHEDLAFIRKERVGGPTLEQVLAAGAPPSVEETINILRQAAGRPRTATCRPGRSRHWRSTGAPIISPWPRSRLKCWQGQSLFRRTHGGGPLSIMRGVHRCFGAESDGRVVLRTPCRLWVAAAYGAKKARQGGERPPGSALRAE